MNSAALNLQPQSITLELPYPVSANQYWRAAVRSPSATAKTGKWRYVQELTEEAKAYKQEVLYIARQAKIYRPITGRVAVDLTLYPALPQDWLKRAQKNIEGWADTVRSLDLDNVFKVTMDSLKNVVFEDDRWVWEIHARRAEPDGKARMVATITSLVSNSPQGKLL